MGQVIKRRQYELPKIEAEIRGIKKELTEVKDANLDLRKQLTDKASRAKPGFIDWLAEEVESIKNQSEQKSIELERKERVRDKLLSTSGLSDLHEAAKSYLKRFEKLSGTERRNMVEKLIKEVQVLRDNRIKVVFYSSPSRPFVNRRKKSSVSEVDGS